jgi:hypothetical protein
MFEIDDLSTMSANFAAPDGAVVSYAGSARAVAGRALRERRAAHVYGGKPTTGQAGEAELMQGSEAKAVKASRQ